MLTDILLEKGKVLSELDDVQIEPFPIFINSLITIAIIRTNSNRYKESLPLYCESLIKKEPSIWRKLIYFFATMYVTMIAMEILTIIIVE